MQNINTKYIIPKELEKMFDIDLNTMNQISKKFNLSFVDTSITFSSNSNSNNLIINKIKYYKYPLETIIYP